MNETMRTKAAIEIELAAHEANLGSAIELRDRLITQVCNVESNVKAMRDRLVELMDELEACNNSEPWDCISAEEQFERTLLEKADRDNDRERSKGEE